MVLNYILFRRNAAHDTSIATVALREQRVRASYR
jgi:hypothetical protein